MRKPIKINRSSFLLVFLKDKTLQRGRRIKRTGFGSSSLPLCKRESSVISIKERKEKREKGFKVFFLLFSRLF